MVRHGQTLFNQKGRIQGWCDSALSDLGVQQAKALHIGLHDIAFNYAYASTSERAFDTASYIIGNRKIPLQQLKGLKEMNFGSLEGEYEKDYMAKDGSTHDKGFVAYGGETITMTQERLVNTIQDIVSHHENKDHILIVSHGGAIMCTLLGLFQMDVQDFRKQGGHIENCSVSIFDYDGDFHLVSISDTTYVNKGLKGE